MNQSLFVSIETLPQKLPFHNRIVHTNEDKPSHQSSFDISSNSATDMEQFDCDSPLM